MKFLYEYWFCIYLRTSANTRADIVPVTLSALFRPQKTYFLLSEGSKSLIITFFLFPELNSINNITMLKKLPDHFNKFYVLRGRRQKKYILCFFVSIYFFTYSYGLNEEKIFLLRTELTPHPSFADIPAKSSFFVLTP